MKPTEHNGFKNEATETISRIETENSNLFELKWFLETALLRFDESYLKKMQPRLLVLGNDIPAELLYAVCDHPFYILGGSLGTAHWADELTPRDTDPFIGMAEFNGKNLIVNAEDELTFSGDEAAIRRLVGIMCENAVKYAPEDSDIHVSLRQSGKNIIFQTENAMKEPLSEEALTHLFDRFYRGDESRSKEETSGFGIGLSVARAITEKHNGTIKAKIVDDDKLQIVCTLPKH